MKTAIEHYEAALKEAFPRGATGEVFYHWNEARYLIATEALDRMAENARELGLDYESAQRKPLTHEQRLEVLTRFKKYDMEWHGPAILIDLVEAAHGIKGDA